jgi:hemerythrin superfamily protein
MDALDLLEQQHRQALALVDNISAEPSPGRRTALVIALVRAVEAHSRVEERYFYPALRARIDAVRASEARIYEAFEEHALMRFVALSLLRTRVTDVRFSARLKLVQELFLRHANVEEDWCFPKAKRNLSDEDLDLIGVEVARAHDVLMQAGVFGPSRLRPRRLRAVQRTHRAHRSVAERARPARFQPTAGE